MAGALWGPSSSLGQEEEGQRRIKDGVWSLVLHSAVASGFLTGHRSQILCMKNILLHASVSPHPAILSVCLFSLHLSQPPLQRCNMLIPPAGNHVAWPSVGPHGSPAFQNLPCPSSTREVSFFLLKSGHPIPRGQALLSVPTLRNMLGAWQERHQPSLEEGQRPNSLDTQHSWGQSQMVAIAIVAGGQNDSRVEENNQKRLSFSGP